MSQALLIPNTTQVPDVIFDEVMPRLSGSALKVLLAILRETYGWQKTSAKISFKKLQEKAGLSRDAISKGVKELGPLIAVTKGKKYDPGLAGVNEYGLNLDIETGKLVRKSDWSENLTSQKRPKLLVRKSDSFIPNKKPKRSPNGSTPGLKETIDLYHDLFIKKFGSKPDISGGRDGKILSGLIKPRGAEKVQALLRQFFDHPPFQVAKNNRFTVPAFKSSFNELLARNGNGGQQMGRLE